MATLSNQKIIQDTPTTFSSDEAGVVDIKIGDEKAGVFKPKISMRKWDDECRVELSLEGNPTGTATNLSSDKLLSCAVGDKQINLHPSDEGFEFDIVLASRPSSNIFKYDLNSKGVTYAYQPFLTKEEKIGRQIFRPKNVEGSYAVYHSSKMNNKYKAGKVGHIYRPKATDALGRYVWCEMDISPRSIISRSASSTHILTVTVPQKFLDNATYPVTVDPNIGKTAVGGTTSVLSTNLILARGFVGGYGYGGSLFAYITNSNAAGGNPEAVMAIYKAGSSEDTYRLCVSDVVSDACMTDWQE